MYTRLLSLRLSSFFRFLLGFARTNTLLTFFFTRLASFRCLDWVDGMIWAGKKSDVVVRLGWETLGLPAFGAFFSYFPIFLLAAFALLFELALLLDRGRKGVGCTFRR